MVEYKVGDWVTLRGITGKHRFAIRQIIQETCSAGTQIIYCGRLYFDEDGITRFTNTTTQIAEMEIKEKIEVI